MNTSVKRLILIGLILGVLTSLAAPLPARASDQITYVSQPEAAAIFLNDVAAIQDTLSLPADADVQIVLPPAIFQDTLIVRENEARISSYRLSRSPDGLQTVLILPPSTSAETAIRQITLDYLLSGLGWKPIYELWLGEPTAATVGMDFSVEIRNGALDLSDVEVRLVAGRVDTSQQVDSVSGMTLNQTIVGYEAAPTGIGLSAAPVTIQHIYPIGKVSARRGDTLYMNLLQSQFEARRVVLWNAPSDVQASVIYKVRNSSELPLPEGIVRAYQDGLFIGSDFMELTPIGSEGSITVGGVQDLRVARTDTVTYLPDEPSETDTLHEVRLTLSNYSVDEIEVEVVDTWVPQAQEFVFSQEPQREAGNLLRWVVTVPSGETVTLEYQFKADY